MLTVTIPETELFDEANNQIITVKETTLRLEHSLVSLSKWESKWCKPFLGKDDKSIEETIDYIRCMTITQNVDPIVYKCLTADIVKEVIEYIQAPMTATWFSADNQRPSREIVTSELIYYWMIALQIPVEFEKWHLNRLLTLVRVCNIKNQPEKKMGKNAIMARNKALNEARKKSLNTTG